MERSLGGELLETPYSVCGRRAPAYLPCLRRHHGPRDAERSWDAGRGVDLSRVRGAWRPGRGMRLRLPWHRLPRDGHLGSRAAQPERSVRSLGTRRPDL